MWPYEPVELIYDSWRNVWIEKFPKDYVILGWGY